MMIDVPDVPASPPLPAHERPYAKAVAAMEASRRPQRKHHATGWAAATKARMVPVTRVDEHGKAIGEPFASATEAGAFIGRTSDSVFNAIVRRRKSGGWYWRRVSEMGEAWSPSKLLRKEASR